MFFSVNFTKLKVFYVHLAQLYVIFSLSDAALKLK